LGGFLLTHQAPKIGSMQSVRGVPRATNGQKVVTLLDEDRSEAYATLDEAIRAAQTWYIGLAGGKLPSWNYRVESLPDFRRAIGHYKSQIAQALGCRSNRLKLRVEAPADSRFFRDQ
jgi:hypothetical protein